MRQNFLQRLENVKEALSIRYKVLEFRLSYIASKLVIWEG